MNNFSQEREQLNNILDDSFWLEKAHLQFKHHEHFEMYFAIQNDEEKEILLSFSDYGYFSTSDSVKKQLTEQYISLDEINNLKDQLSSFFKQNKEFCYSAIFCHQRNRRISLIPEPSNFP